MSIVPVKTPLIVKKMFPNYIWDIATSDKTIYLTFDDGPTPEITNWTLDLLKKHQAQATFFCIGNNIQKYPEIFQDILEAGHTIGNHTFNHVKGWQTKTEDYITEVLKTQAIIDSETQNNTMTKLFRPPHGRIKNSQAKRLLADQYKIIMWDVLSFDWDKSISEETCLNKVLSKASNGSIIVFHDSLKAAKNMQYALPKVLEYYSQKGYTFKALNL
ncbi:polysaccharide deacetylase family protein [Tamlana haliotis]|uniref:Polysaccharide deacetylase family protein n=1 Tax=Pseudotamlana haliotis TaxID=2614804 RepID=A0A6N6ML58_9FLAO|nr:polysaccharide deacetylase family protein [Tamlana haliotis]KAB1069681.1 polysaccharide deacetylase family protein [Tamlana haliotis]